MIKSTRLLWTVLALCVCNIYAATTNNNNTPATSRVVTPTSRVQTPSTNAGTSRVVTPSQDTGTSRAITSVSSNTGTTAVVGGLPITCLTTGTGGTCSRTSTRTRNTARTTVLFPPLQTQYRLSDITADLINQV